MNVSAKTNKSIGRDMLVIGIILTVIGAAFFFYKHFAGYYDVEKVETKEGLYVYTEAGRTYRHTRRGRRYRYIYHIRVTENPTELPIFYHKVDKRLFRRYQLLPNKDNVTLTFYRCGDFVFPVIGKDATPREAELELRHIVRPTGWYLFYYLTIGGGGLLILGGLRGFRIAKRYEDPSDPYNKPYVPSPQSTEMGKEMDRLVAERNARMASYAPPEPEKPKTAAERYKQNADTADLLEEFDRLTSQDERFRGKYKQEFNEHKKYL
ncbi:MAG: hypothetical protein IJ737_02460 [Ruminococcus sp.]|nr:hypothetical protein [Ruminococcus sp.]